MGWWREELDPLLCINKSSKSSFLSFYRDLKYLIRGPEKARPSLCRWSMAFSLFSLSPIWDHSYQALCILSTTSQVPPLCWNSTMSSNTERSRHRSEVHTKAGNKVFKIWRANLIANGFGQCLKHRSWQIRINQSSVKEDLSKTALCPRYISFEWLWPLPCWILFIG